MIDNYLPPPWQVEYTGLTGEIKFDADGFRTHFPLDLMEKFHNRLKKTAVSRYLHYLSIISTTPQVTVLLLTVTALLCWSRGRPGDTKKRTNPRQ